MAIPTFILVNIHLIEDNHLIKGMFNMIYLMIMYQFINFTFFRILFYV